MKQPPILLHGLDSALDNVTYSVGQVEIEEALSEVTKTTVTLAIAEDSEKNIWDIHIPLHHRAHVEINIYEEIPPKEQNNPNSSSKNNNANNNSQDQEEYKNQNEYKLLWSKNMHGFTTHIKKEYKEFNNVVTPLLIIEFRHRLFELHYDNRYKIHKLRTHAEIIEDTCRLKEVVLFNECPLMHVERIRMFNQFGENNLHLFERLVQHYGAFFYCHDGGLMVTIHDSELGYRLMFPFSETYTIGKSIPNTLNTIYSIEMEENQVPRDYVTMDYNIKKSDHVYGYWLEFNGYGKRVQYPAYREDVVGAEQQAHHLKKQFVKKKYKCKSFCYKIQPGKRIVIDTWDHNREHVVISVKHSWFYNVYNNKLSYKNEFMLHDRDGKSYVTDKYLPPPIIPGVQTATVKARSPAFEIETNRDAEVLVQFHWMHEIPEIRDGFILGSIVDIVNAIEYYSAWVPVGQVMAGEHCGSYIIPRVGDEVLVYFIDGNPDRPIIFGSIFNDKRPNYARDDIDHYKIVLMRSRTFYQEHISLLGHHPNTKYNEISMVDRPYDEKLYLKAQKDLDCLIGDIKTPETKSNFTTLIAARGDQKHHITDGRYSLTIDLGSKDEIINGPSRTLINMSEKGRDMEIIIDKGRYLLDAGGGSLQEYGLDLTINVVGKCTINTEGDTKILTEGMTHINSVGEMSVSSESIVKILAPTIHMEAEGDIRMIAGGDINMDVAGILSQKVGGDINTEVIGKSSTKAGGIISMDAAGDINQISAGMISSEALVDISLKAGAACSIEAAGEITNAAGGFISIDALGDVNMKTAGVCSIEALAECNITSLSMSVETGLETNIVAGLSFTVEAGLDASISSGLSATMESGLTVDMSAGLSASVDAGLAADMSAGLSTSVDAGLSADMSAGLATSQASGLAADISAGLETAFNAGVNFSGDAGVMFELNAALVGTASTAILVFVKRPRL